MSIVKDVRERGEGSSYPFPNKFIPAAVRAIRWSCGAGSTWNSLTSTIRTPLTTAVDPATILSPQVCCANLFVAAISTKATCFLLSVIPSQVVTVTFSSFYPVVIYSFTTSGNGLGRAKVRWGSLPDIF